MAAEVSATKKVSVSKVYPGMGSLPYNVQRMLAGQVHQADVRRESGKPPPTWIKPGGTACGCKFYRKWLLPCEHYFHAAEEDESILSPERWAAFALLFEELGYDVYLKTITLVEEADQERNPQQQVIDRMREINEVYRDLAYELVEQVVERPAEGILLLAEYHQIVLDGMTRLGNLRSRMRAVAAIA